MPASPTEPEPPRAETGASHSSQPSGKSLGGGRSKPPGKQAPGRCAQMEAAGMESNKTKPKKPREAGRCCQSRGPWARRSAGREQLLMCLFGIQRVNGTVGSVLCKHFWLSFACFFSVSDSRGDGERRKLPAPLPTPSNTPKPHRGMGRGSPPARTPSGEKPHPFSFS